MQRGRTNSKLNFGKSRDALDKPQIKKNSSSIESWHLASKRRPGKKLLILETSTRYTDRRPKFPRGICYGPPGTGKTLLARLLQVETESHL